MAAEELIFKLVRSLRLERYWARAQQISARQNVDPLIGAFLKKVFVHLHKEPLEQAREGFRFWTEAVVMIIMIVFIIGMAPSAHNISFAKIPVSA